MSEFELRLRREQSPAQRAEGGHGRAPKNPDPYACLYAFFDLACCAIDFGVTEFLVLATEEAKKRGLDQVHIVYVPAANDTFRTHGTPTRLADEWRVQNILLQAPWLCPVCIGITWCTTREQAAMMVAAAGPHVLPVNYDVADGADGYLSAYISREVIKNHQGRDFRHLRATPSSRDLVRRWLDHNVGGRKVVTISLREAPGDISRNSHIREWVKFAHTLDVQEYCPVFVRDTETLFGGDPWVRSDDEDFVRGNVEALADLDHFLDFPEASLNMHARTALYELSFANLMVNTGPAALCIYNANVNYLVFRYCVDSAYSSGEGYLNWIGLKRGGAHPFAGPAQKLVWDEDTAEVIGREFDLLAQTIRAGEG